MLIMPQPFDHFENNEQGPHMFLAIDGEIVRRFETHQEVFLGSYRTNANPRVVHRGQCRNSSAVGHNGSRACSYRQRVHNRLSVADAYHSVK